MKSKCRIRARFIGAGFRSIGFHDQLLPAIALILRRCFRGVRLSPRLAARRPLNCKNDSTEMMDSFVNNGCVSFASFFFLPFRRLFFLSLSFRFFSFRISISKKKNSFYLFISFFRVSFFFRCPLFVARVSCFIFFSIALSLFLVFSLSLSFFLSISEKNVY